MTFGFNGVGGLGLPISEADAKKASHSKPVLCAVRQPWKQEGITLDDIALDLTGCIVKHWSYYRDVFKADYSLCEAWSDAIIGIQKAIVKDALAPCGGKATCECGHTFRVPSALPDDEQQNKLFREASFGECPVARVIEVECPECHAAVSKRIIKTIFSTHVFQFIRAEIQRGARLANGKKGTVSISNPCGEAETTIEESLAAKEENEEDKVPVEIMNAIHDCINDLSPNSRRIISLHYGFGGITEDVVEVIATCRHCNGSFDATVDYSLSVNSKECPHCEADNLIPMNLKQTEIAKILNVSKQRVCALIKKAHDRLTAAIPATKLYA
jgi:RNA polymerase sigma factor (sigma-70 family)